jgi:ribosome-binding ATPase YchF (GTP1/OBG family)
MKVGLVGYSGSGKSTVFQWLTGARPDPGKAQFGQTGVARVPDARLDWLSAHFKPKKTTHAALEFLDTPGLLATERRDNPRRLAILRESNGLLVVLNGFSEGDPAGQLTRFREEILFADLEIVTNRIDKLEEQLKKPKPAKLKEIDQAEHDLLRRLATALEQGQSPATLGLRDDEEKAIRSFQLLTLKPELVLLNVGDSQAGAPVPAPLKALAPTAVAAPARLEVELLELPEDERQAFLTDLGLKGFVHDETLRTIFYAMGQIVFFTIGEDECRAWPMPKGTDAVVGAGKIHTELAKRFVRATVIRYEDFVRCGSEKEAKHQGLQRLEGKTYLVQDGDIMHIL